MKSLFEYLEYRDYLRDHFEDRKRRYPFFSYRYVAAKTGLDASFYVKVLQKQMHIAEKAIGPLADFLKLGKREAEYFRELVRFNRARRGDQGKSHFERLLALREPRALTLDAARYEYFRKWYYIAIRESLSVIRFTGNYKELAERLSPPIRVAEARRAIALLGKLGLIRQGPDGAYVPAEPFVSTGESWSSLAIENFQQEAIALAGASIRRHPKSRRETSTLTLSLSWKAFAALKERLREVRQEILELARQDETPEAVFQVNFLAFPLTRPEKDGPA